LFCGAVAALIAEYASLRREGAVPVGAGESLIDDHLIGPPAQTVLQYIVYGAISLFHGSRTVLPRRRFVKAMNEVILTPSSAGILKIIITL